MFRSVLLRTIAVIIPALAIGAGPKDGLESAVKNLANSSSYSWTTTVDGGFAGRNIVGKIEKDGPISLSINFGDDMYDLILNGKKAAAKGAFGWASTADLERSAEEEDGFGPERFLLMTIRNFKSPAEQAQDLIDEVEDVQKSGDEYAAELPPRGAERFVSGFRRLADNLDPLKIQVKNPRGSLKCWLSEGRLAKLQVHVQGTLIVKGNDRAIDRTTMTEIKAIGSTKVTVPTEAAAKL